MKYVTVAFFRGASLRPVPPGESTSKDMRYRSGCGPWLDRATAAVRPRPVCRSGEARYVEANAGLERTRTGITKAKIRAAALSPAAVFTDPIEDFVSTNAVSWLVSARNREDDPNHPQEFNCVAFFV